MNNVDYKNPPTPSGWTPMHYAARKGKMKVCRLIMENVHGKNPPTNFGWTPLHQAEGGGGPEKRSGHKRPREAADLPESSTADTQEDETTEKVLSDANEVVENTKVTVQEHTIVVDGSELSERKELEFVVDGNSEGQRSSIFRDLQILSNSNEKRSGVCWRKTMIPTKPSDVLSVWSTLSARGIVQEEPKDDQTREKVCHCIVVSDVAPTMSSKRIIVKFSR